MSEILLEALVSPSFEVRNKRKELIFSMKRKGQEYGQVYYIFETHLDRIEPERMGKFQLAWALVRVTAKRMGIPLYNINEIQKSVQYHTNLVKEGESVDISLPVKDFATGKINHLTVGVKAYKQKG